MYADRVSIVNTTLAYNRAVKLQNASKDITELRKNETNTIVSKKLMMKIVLLLHFCVKTNEGYGAKRLVEEFPL